MTQAQIQGKFRAINPTIATYINASNVSIKFDEKENVQNFLNLEIKSKKKVEHIIL